MVLGRFFNHQRQPLQDDTRRFSCHALRSPPEPLEAEQPEEIGAIRKLMRFTPSRDWCLILGSPTLKCSPTVMFFFCAWNTLCKLKRRQHMVVVLEPTFQSDYMDLKETCWVLDMLITSRSWRVSTLALNSNNYLTYCISPVVRRQTPLICTMGLP